MARRRKPEKRTILPDPKFHSQRLAKFINTLMLDGKKSVAEKIVYGALDLVAEKRKGNHIEMFEKVIENINPVVEVRSRRVGGATYQVPAPVRPERQEALAMRWLIEASRKRTEKGMQLRLAAEMSDAFDGRGSAIKKKEEIYRMAEANKAFSHFRW